MKKNKESYPEISLFISKEEIEPSFSIQTATDHKQIQEKTKKMQANEGKFNQRYNCRNRPQRNQGFERGGPLNYHRGPLSGRLGGPNREPSNMRRHPETRHNIQKRNKRLTMPSMRSRPSPCARTTRSKKHASLKSSSDESENSSNNFKKERLKNQQRKETKSKRTDSPTAKEYTENNNKEKSQKSPSTTKPVRSEDRSSQKKASESIYLRNNKQKKNKNDKERRRETSLETETVKSWLHSPNSDGNQIDKRTRQTEIDNLKLLEQNDRMRSDIRSHREEQKKLQRSLEVTTSELAEVKQKLRDRNTYVDGLISRHREMLLRSYERIDEGKNLCKELESKSARLQKEKNHLEKECKKTDEKCDSLEKKLQKAEKTLKSKDETAAKNKEETERKMAMLQTEKTRLQKDLETSKRNLKARISELEQMLENKKVRRSIKKPKKQGLKRKMNVTTTTTSPKTKKRKLGERFKFEVKIIPVESQSEDSESEATEESNEERDDRDRTEGLGQKISNPEYQTREDPKRGTDAGSKAETHPERNETASRGPSREEDQWRRRLDTSPIRPTSVPAILKEAEPWEPTVGPLSSNLGPFPEINSFPKEEDQWRRRLDTSPISHVSHISRTSAPAILKEAEAWEATVGRFADDFNSNPGEEETWRSPFNLTPVPEYSNELEVQEENANSL